MLPGSAYLLLTDQGFTFSMLYLRTFVAWGDVRDIRVVWSKGSCVIGWTYASHLRAKKKMPRRSRDRDAVDARLPFSYGMDVVELSSLMSAVLAQHRGHFRYRRRMRLP